MAPQLPTATISMLIRCRAEEAFRSFIEPESLRRFWLAGANAPTVAGQIVEWQFMVPGASATTHVIDVVADSRIEFEWPDEARVVLRFDAAPDGTAVAIELRDLGELSADKASAAFDLVSGFTIVLCDLKTLLESGQSASLTRDKAHLIARSQSGVTQAPSADRVER